MPLERPALRQPEHREVAPLLPRSRSAQDEVDARVTHYRLAQLPDLHTQQALAPGHCGLVLCQRSRHKTCTAP